MDALLHGSGLLVQGSRSADGHRLGLLLLEVHFRDHLVDDAIRLGLFRRHEEVAVRVLLDLRQRLVRVPDQDLVQLRPQREDLLRVDLDVGRLPLATAGSGGS